MSIVIFKLNSFMRRLTFYIALAADLIIALTVEEPGSFGAFIILILSFIVANHITYLIVYKGQK